MADYIRQMSAREVVRASFFIYLRHFRQIALIWFIPMLPLIGFGALGHVWKETWMVLGTNLVTFGISFFVSAAVTVVIGDICLDHPVSVRSAYRRVAGPAFTKIFITWSIIVVLVAVGLVALVIPGIVLSVFYMFAVCVATLEGIGGRQALKRSRMLGRGHHFRNFVVLTAVTVLCYLAMIVILITIAVATAVIAYFGEGALFAEWNVDHPVVAWLLAAVGGVIAHVSVPPTTVAIVLLYYDMRARKEAYDSTALAAELMH